MRTIAMNNRICIAGASFAGLAAAIRLGQMGQYVVVCDPRTRLAEDQMDLKVIHPKYAGGKSLDLLAGLRVANAAHPVFSVRRFAPSGREMHITSQDVPLYFIVENSNSSCSMKQALFEQAQGLGVEFRFSEFASLKETDVIACGSSTPEIKGAGMTILLPSKREPEVWMFEHPMFVQHGGYVYVAIHGMAATAVAVALTANVENLFNQALEIFPPLSALVSSSTARFPVAGGTSCRIPKSAALGRAVVTGGAAGFAEASRGFGVYYALKSGILAAESIVLDTPYDTLWKQAFEAELGEGVRKRASLSARTRDDLEDEVITGDITLDEYINSVRRKTNRQVQKNDNSPQQKNIDSVDMANMTRHSQNVK